jgi:hypothetical protein
MKKQNLILDVVRCAETRSNAARSPSTVKNSLPGSRLVKPPELHVRHWLENA